MKCNFLFGLMKEIQDTPVELHIDQMAEYKSLLILNLNMLLYIFLLFKPLYFLHFQYTLHQFCNNPEDL